MSNKEEFLKAAQWALDGGSGINIRRIGIEPGRCVTLFNGSKSLMYDGYTHPYQHLLKGLIVEEVNGNAVKVLAGCLRKFFNYGENNEKEQYKKYLNDDYAIFFLKKEDGVNVRNYFNPVTNRVEFATRGTLTGVAMNDLDIEEDETLNTNKFLNYGQLAREIAKEKYPILLDPIFTNQFPMIFEMIHPEASIITNYGDTKDLILLGAFHSRFDWSEYSRETLEEFAKSYKFNIVGKYAELYSAKDFYDYLPAVEQKWKGTDDEGTVVLFETFDYPITPVYRLKIKNAEYLATLKMMRYCSLKNLKLIIDEYNLKTWEEIRTHLYKHSSINEEVEMAYKEHYDVYCEWKVKCEQYKLNIYIQFKALPQFDTQKEFALHIKDHPLKSYFFELRKSNYSFDKIDIMIEKEIPLGEDLHTL